MFPTGSTRFLFAEEVIASQSQQVVDNLVDIIPSPDGTAVICFTSGERSRMTNTRPVNAFEE